MHKSATLFLSLFVVLLFAGTGAASETSPEPFDLGRPLFVSGDVSLDRDRDGLQDRLEYMLADHFKPYLFFDSEEKALEPNEPRVLFQVRPEGCIGEGCKKPWRVWIAFSFLFLRDGGYGKASKCPFNGAHKGDNDRLRIRLESNDGRIWRVVRVENSHAQKRDKAEFIWPGTSANVQWHLGRHVHIYMSGSKHHQYFDTDYDAEDSPYSGAPIEPCDEDVDGNYEGGPMLPSLLSPYPDRRPSNVGELNHHDPDYFINALAPYGFPDHNPLFVPNPKVEQTAWGGWGTFYNSGTHMRDLWMTHNFDFGPDFCRYAPNLTRKRVTLTFLEVVRSQINSEMASDSFSFDFIVNGERMRYPATGKSNVPVGGALDLSGGGLTKTFEYLCGVQLIHFEVRDAAGNVFRDELGLQQGFGSGIREATIKRTILVDREDGPSVPREQILFTTKYQLSVVNIPGDKRRPLRTVIQ